MEAGSSGIEKKSASGDFGRINSQDEAVASRQPFGSIDSEDDTQLEQIDSRDSHNRNMASRQATSIARRDSVIDGVEGGLNFLGRVGEASPSQYAEEGRVRVEAQQEREEEATAAADENVDDFSWGARKHIFVLSSAGKPVFSLTGDEQRLSTLMGHIQGLLSLCADCGEDDEMESISTDNRRFVFLRKGDLVLVAVSSSTSTLSCNRKNSGSEGSVRSSSSNSGGSHAVSIVEQGHEREEEEGGGEEALECESFMRLQLEYLYASILFLLTSKVTQLTRQLFLQQPQYRVHSTVDSDFKI